MFTKLYMRAMKNEREKDKKMAKKNVQIQVMDSQISTTTIAN